MTNALERFLLIAILVAVCYLLPLFTVIDEGNKNLDSFAKEQVNEFLADISNSGKVTMEDYLLLVDILVRCNYPGDLKIEEYYYEFGIDGKDYQYVTSWGEIQQALLETGEFTFKDESYAFVSVYGNITENELINLFLKKNSIVDCERIDN